MLHQRTSSAANLRLEGSRRRAVRNLKAKVRALIPSQLCIKPLQIINILRKDESKSAGKLTSSHLQQSLIKSKNRNKIFEKLSKKQIEQINENKPYFFGNQTIIEFYDLYVKDKYAQMTTKQWKTPQYKKDSLFPVSFLPENLIRHSHQQNNRKSPQTHNSGLGKTSFSRSILDKYAQVEIPLQKRQLNTSKSRQKSLINRKMMIEQQLKARRQINSMHLNRQINSALSRKQQFISEKVKSIKRSSPKIVKKDIPTEDLDKFTSIDISGIAQKLRKICLFNKNNIKK